MVSDWRQLMLVYQRFINLRNKSDPQNIQETLSVWRKTVRLGCALSVHLQKESKGREWPIDFPPYFQQLSSETFASGVINTFSISLQGITPEHLIEIKDYQKVISHWSVTNTVHND